MKYGLKTKIDLILIGSLVALGTMGTLTFSTLQNRIVRHDASEDVAKARSVLERVVGRRASDLTSQTELIADLPTMKAVMAYSNPDAATVAQRFGGYEKSLHVDSYLITDDIGRPITRAGTFWDGRQKPETIAGVREAMAGHSWHGILVRQGQLALGVSVPVTMAGYVKGTITVFQRFDSSTASGLANDLGADVAFLQRGQVLGSSFGATHIGRSGPGGTVEVEVNGRHLIGQTSPFPGAAIGEDVSMVTLRDFDALAKPFDETRRDMIFVLATLMGLIILISRAVSRNLITQLDNLIFSVRSLEDGKWPEPIQTNRTDEIGLLQSSFNDMSTSLRDSHELLIRKTEDLNVALVRAEAATRAKTDFLATVSHELRTPLNGIFGMTGLLKETPLNLQQREYLKVLSQSNEHLFNLINDVLSYSELESGRAVLVLEEFNLEHLIKETVSAYETDAEVKNLQLTTFIDPACEGTFRSDATRVRQVLSNLISNAVKFTAHGFVEVQCAAVGDKVSIQVKDSGCGISPERQEEMFMPFHQADNTSARRYGGTGLGLSICRQIAVVMGASLTVCSESGAGSTFQFLFDPERVSLPEVEHFHGSPIAGLKVLIVDDNPVNLKVAAKILEKAGAQVECAESGEAALEMLPSGYGLILMDCHMPEMDGFECTLHIREREAGYGHTTPVIALTASNLDEDRQRSAEVGMNGYLVKPLRLPMIEHEFQVVTSSRAA